MAAPTVRAVGTSAAALTAISPGLPAGTAVGDLLLMFCETQGAEAITASGWTNLPVQSPIDNSTSTRLTILYRVATGTDATTTSDSGDHQLAQIVGITVDTFDPVTPFDGAGGSNTQASTASVSITGSTTTVNDCLVVAASVGAVPTGPHSAWANADLTDIVNQVDTGTTQGSDGSVTATTGTMATAGTYAATTATASVATVRANISFAVAPAAAEAPDAPTLNTIVQSNMRS